MSDPIQSFSGISSGIQWRDLVDQLVALDTRRRVTPLQTELTSRQKQIDAWTRYQSLVASFQNSARSLADGTAFSAFTATAAASATSGRAVLSATADATAAPGSYRAEVVGLATAAKLSASDVASTSAALGFAGDVAINGVKISVVAGDSLTAIRDRINAANVGATATHVVATIVTTGPQAFRLQLSSDTTGAEGIRLVDGAGGGVLRQLGIVDGSLVQNLSAAGAPQSSRFASASSTVASQVGLTAPAAATITVGGRSISVDLAADSLQTLAARITAAGGTAEVLTGSANGTAYSRLSVNGTVSASTADGTRALEMLGFLTDGRSGIAQVVTSADTYTDAGVTATAASLLTNLSAAGQPIGVAAGDTFKISGRRGDGTTVSTSFTVASTDTVQTVLDRLNDPTTGFARTGRSATATFVNGQFVLTDGTAGDSQLAVSLTATTPAGSIKTLGPQNTTTIGRLREISAGADAQLRLDGVLLTRSTNTISDAIKGVSLSLLTAEPGSTVDVTVARDAKATTSALNSFATAYNDVVKFVDSQRVAGAPLANNGGLRASVASIRNTLLNSVSGVTSTSYNQLATVGVALDKTGMLTVDQSMLTAALAKDPAAVSALFAIAGTPSAPTLSYVASTDKSVAGNYAVSVTTVAVQGTATGTGFTGTYADDATADTMTIVDGQTGKTSSIQLANGDTLDAIVARLNSAFSANGAALTASKSGTNLVLRTSGYGTAASFTVSYTAGGASGTAQLGIAAGTFAGVDVAGSIGGLAATGRGQVLTGVAGGVTEGLAISYSGTVTGAVGSLNFVVGAGGAAQRAATRVSDSTTGTVAQTTQLLQQSLGALTSRIARAQQLVESRRAALIAQFTAMEAAVSRIQAQGARFTSQFQALTNPSR